MNRFMLNPFSDLYMIKFLLKSVAPCQKHWHWIGRLLRREENFVGVRILHFGPTRKTTHINVPAVRRERTCDKAWLVWNWNSVRSVTLAAPGCRRRCGNSYQWFRCWSRAWTRTGSGGCVALDSVFMGRALRRRFLLRMRDRVAQRLQ